MTQENLRRKAIAAALNSMRVEVSVDARKAGPLLTRRKTLEILVDNPRMEISGNFKHNGEVVKAIFDKKREEKDDWRPGEMTKTLRLLSTHERDQIISQARRVDEEQSYGRYGNPAKVIRETGANPQVLMEVVDGLQLDDTTKSLMDRMGTDSSLPPPELTSRDFVQAAWTAAGGADFE